MIAAGQWQPVIGESELPGGKLPETARERETGCPGVAASSPYLLTSRKGRWPRSSCGFVVVRARIGSGFGKHAALVARAVWLKQSRRRFRGDSGKRRNPRLMRSGVAGPGPHSSWQFSVLSSQFSVLSSPFSVLSFPFSAENLRIRCGSVARFPQKMHALWSSGHPWLRG